MKLQKKTSLLATLALSGMASLAAAQTPPTTVPSFTKMRADAQKSRVVDFGITLAPFPDGYSYRSWSQNVKRNQLEINAVVRKEWRAAQGEQPPTFHWVGNLEPLVSAHKHDTNGYAYPYFGEEQKYVWSLERASGIVLKDPDPNASAQTQLEQAIAPSTAKKQFRLDFGEGGGLEEYNKVNLQPGAWPKVTTANVGVTGGVNSEILPAQAKINWHMPYTTEFQIHLKLQVQLPGTLTNPEGILIDLGEISQDDLMDDLGSDWSDAMVMDKLRRGTPAVFGGVGATVFRLAAEGVFVGRTITTPSGISYLYRAPANFEAGEAFIKQATPWLNRVWAAYVNANSAFVQDGATLVATVTVTKVGTHGLLDHTVGGNDIVFPRSLKRTTDIPDIPASPGEGTSDEEGEDIGEQELGSGWVRVKPNPQPNPQPNPNPGNPGEPHFVPQPQTRLQPRQQPDNDTVTKTVPKSLYVYFYSPTLSTSDHWTGGGNSLWQPAYYYTNLSPERVFREKLSEGRLSFSLYGHPYGRPHFAYRVEVSTTEMATLKASWTEFSAEIRERVWSSKRPRTDFDSRVSREIYRSEVEFSLGQPLPNGKIRSVTRINVIHHPDAQSAPGAADVPPGTRAPAANKGKWFMPGTTTEWPQEFPLEGIDPATGIKRRLNSDWLPPIGSIQYRITGGQAVQYRNGYPNFTPWKKFSTPLDAYTGHATKRPMEGNAGSDFNQARADFAIDQNLTNQEALDWIEFHNIEEPNGQVIATDETPRWVWHHHQDMLHMQLVPSHLNTAGRFGGLAHDGGAQLAVNARW